jgi:hypothetical protein
VADRCILQIEGIYGEEICVDRCNICAACFVQHHPKGGVPFPISFKGKELRPGFRVQNKCYDKEVCTFPLFFIRALRCEVLLPGAAVASMTTASSKAGGDKMSAGKQEALSCRMIFPEMYRGSSWKQTREWKRSKFGTCSSIEKCCL